MAETAVNAPGIVISAVGLTKVFRDFWNRPKAKAVNDVDFEAREGEVLGLLGPNGSGKSTTVKMLLGLLYPTGGRLTVFGKSPRDVAVKRLIGYLPEESCLYPYLSAYETLDFFGSLFSLSAAERCKRAEQLLEMVGLSHAKNRAVGEFSKGMSRRIGLAQAMINDPALLILDEPTAGLDPLGCREVKDLIHLLKKRGKTVLVTSHLLSDIEDVCDRVIILYGGKIRAQGTLNELLTITGSDRITTPQLKPEVLEKVLASLRSQLTEEEFRIDHPRMTLEEFFLKVVNQAQAESVETDGARSGGQIADYLAGSGEEMRVRKELLASLARPDEAPEEAGEAGEAESGEAEAELDTAKLAGLSDGLRQEEKTGPAAETMPEELAAANEKLKDMLSGPGGKKE